MSHQTLASRQFWLPAKQAEARAAHSLSVRSSSRSAFPLSKRQRLQTLCSSTKTNEGEIRRKALGSIVIETNEDLPDPPESDFWEGGAWQWFGKLAIAIVPILIAAAIGTGLYAAVTYNTGADKILKPAGEDTPAQIVDGPQ